MHPNLIEKPPVEGTKHGSDFVSEHTNSPQQSLVGLKD